MAQYIMALDAGTTSNRCILFDQEGRVRAAAQKEFPQIFPRPGWVEHDATGDLGHPAGRGGGGHGKDRRHGRGHRRHRHHQPAGDHRGLGQGHRGAGVQRHRLAVPPHQRLLRRAESKGLRGGDPPEDGAGGGRLLLRPQDPLDPGQRPRRPAAGGGGGAPLRHSGDLADLAAHRRPGPRHRLLQRLPDHALQHQHPGLG